jgi:hypothetical protein
MPSLLENHPLHAADRGGEILYRTLASGRLSPSYLLEGSDPEALRVAALDFAAGILLGSPPAAFDEAAARRVRAGHHPDVFVLEKDKATVISVRALTAALERAHMTPLEGTHQVFLIQPADAMEPEGIARYLKSLEEPPPGTVFVLLTCRAERLPDTVLSRCKRVRFPPLAAARIAELLSREDVDADTAAAAARLASGSLAAARRGVATSLDDSLTQLIAAAESAAPEVAKVTDGVLAHIGRCAADLAAADTAETDTKRQHVRELCADVVRALSVEARERSAEKASRLPACVGPQAALDLLARWAELSAAVAANVTPHVVILAAVAALRAAVEASGRVVR